MAAAAMLAIAPASASCRARAHERVVLYGSGEDPGVFVWATRFGLRAYHIATFDEAQEMAPRALLVSGGTRAIVIRCVPHYVVAPFGLGVDDAVYVEILTGRSAGRVGWVSGSDVKTL
jgi:hypothetical protein